MKKAPQPPGGGPFLLAMRWSDVAGLRLIRGKLADRRCVVVPNVIKVRAPLFREPALREGISLTMSANSIQSNRSEISYLTSTPDDFSWAVPIHAKPPAMPDAGWFILVGSADYPCGPLLSVWAAEGQKSLHCQSVGRSDGFAVIFAIATGHVLPMRSGALLIVFGILRAYGSGAKGLSRRLGLLGDWRHHMAANRALAVTVAGSVVIRASSSKELLNQFFKRPSRRFVGCRRQSDWSPWENGKFTILQSSLAVISQTSGG